MNRSMRALRASGAHGEAALFKTHATVCTQPWPVSMPGRLQFQREAPLIMQGSLQTMHSHTPAQYSAASRDLSWCGQLVENLVTVQPRTRDRPCIIIDPSLLARLDPRWEERTRCRVVLIQSLINDDII